jgi:hypothetical protein
MTPQVEDLIGRIKQAASEAPPCLQDIGMDGRFNGLLNTTNYLDDDACSTLGTITFQQFAPKDLKVCFRVPATEALASLCPIHRRMHHSSDCLRLH